MPGYEDSGTFVRVETKRDFWAAFRAASLAACWVWWYDKGSSCRSSSSRSFKRASRSSSSVLVAVMLLLLFLVLELFVVVLVPLVWCVLVPAPAHSRRVFFHSA